MKCYGGRPILTKLQSYKATKLQSYEATLRAEKLNSLGFKYTPFGEPVPQRKKWRRAFLAMLLLSSCSSAAPNQKLPNEIEEIGRRSYFAHYALVNCDVEIDDPVWIKLNEARKADFDAFKRGTLQGFDSTSRWSAVEIDYFCQLMKMGEKR